MKSEIISFDEILNSIFAQLDNASLYTTYYFVQMRCSIKSWYFKWSKFEHEDTFSDNTKGPSKLMNFDFCYLENIF